MRTAFIQELTLAAETNPKIFLLCGDLGFSVLETFNEKFPDRFLNVGIAEQNMIGVASGLALEGYQVYVYSIGNFPTLRCMEQIRYDVCYHNLDVKVVAVGAGYAYGPLGASHHATEEIGMMRTIPRMKVYSPADPAEARACVKDAVHNPGPGYLRIGKAGEPKIHVGEVANVDEFQLVREGQSTACICTGSIIEAVLKNEAYAGMSVYSVPVVKPLHLLSLLKIALSHEKLVTFEEHQKDAGFGSAILEGLSDLIEAGKLAAFPNIKRLGINNKFVDFAGTQDYMRARSIFAAENFKA